MLNAINALKVKKTLKIHFRPTVLINRYPIQPVVALRKLHDEY